MTQYIKETEYRVEFKRPTESKWTTFEPNEPVKVLSEAIDRLNFAKKYHKESGLESWKNYEYRIAQVESFISYVEC